MIRSVLLVLNRQKIFEGDLNSIQQIALTWIINNEMEDKVELERLRALNTGLATNPATSRDFILKMIEEQQEVFQPEENWTTPKSIQEIEDFLTANALN